MSVALHLEAEVPGIDSEQFQEIAQNAKNTCPVSQALSAIEVTLNASLL